MTNDTIQTVSSYTWGVELTSSLFFSPLRETTEHIQETFKISLVYMATKREHSTSTNCKSVITATTYPLCTPSQQAIFRKVSHKYEVQGKGGGRE